MRTLLPFALMLSACASFPELEGTISDAARDAPYPALSEIPVRPATGSGNEATMLARIEALQARAARIRKIEIGALQ
ncbi:hypothetical protein MWU60_18865 [Yoonia sp. F2084L]|uniref:hypothetical protein n=1 Tax=Yoonia sp. F2084L TaxID=2926419 RepID=UPI001FF2A6EB|nr:hypothetical protein [Yoonia sp. F2084L]MCK0097642.1 hypothetical protein [Yoonia sp. F2084L]